MRLTGRENNSSLCQHKSWTLLTIAAMLLVCNLSYFIAKNSYLRCIDFLREANSKTPDLQNFALAYYRRNVLSISLDKGGRSEHHSLNWTVVGQLS